ncbi:MAG: phosphate acyltransferase PlsX [Pseudomonadota bacterium]
MSSEIRIAIDAMGGDNGADVVVPGALRALKKHPNLHLVLVGDERILKLYLSRYKNNVGSRLTLQHASEVVSMDESPTQALRYKKDSSMRVAINLVKQQKVQACVSAGNTGALMATAHFVLKTLPGINRAAIICALPANNELKRVRVLDVGANVDASPETLCQFAMMGSTLVAAVDGKPNPKVALLNIGVEQIKGNEQVKETDRLLSSIKDLNYIGYVEGDDIFKGTADVVVCDGFIGNVTLKTIEGLAKFIGGLIKKEFYRNFLTKLSALCATLVLRSLKKSLNPHLYNGASFVGLQGIVIKSHGKTTVAGFAQAIECAISEIEHNVPELIKNEIARLLANNQTS